MNEPLDSVHTAGLQQDVSANYIVVGESETVAVGIVSPSFILTSPTNMALRSKVENVIYRIRCVLFYEVGPLRICEYLLRCCL